MFRYLKSLQKIACSASLAEYTIVVGNQAADMDSCCSALLVAYLESEINHNLTVPLIDVPREDMRLRRDIEFVFRNLGISSDWLLFSNDLLLDENSRLFLVDHNAATQPGVVRSIIDHHEIEDKQFGFKGVQPLKIVKSGSCMSAVVNYYVETFRTEMTRIFNDEPQLSELALSPMVLDTNQFTKKVEDEDRRALSFLTRYSSSNVNTFSPLKSFAEMKKEKSNLSGLTTRDLLRKDYKSWGKIGISSLPNLFEKLAKKGLQDLPGALHRFKDQQDLEIMIALASGNNPRTDSYVRQLAYVGPADFDIAQRCPNLRLEIVSITDDVVFFNQSNTAASRKQVAPSVREAYRQYTQES